MMMVMVREIVTTVRKVIDMSKEHRYIVYEDEDGEHETDTLDGLFGHPDNRRITDISDAEAIEHFQDLHGGHWGGEVWNVRIAVKV